MIKEVIRLNILADNTHQVYKPSKGTLERLLKIGSHAPPRPPQAPSSSHGPAASHNPSQAVLLAHVVLLVLQERRKEF